MSDVGKPNPQGSIANSHYLALPFIYTFTAGAIAGMSFVSCRDRHGYMLTVRRRMYRAPRKLLRVFRSGVTQHVPLLLSTTNAHLSNLALSTCNLLDHLVSPLRQLLYPLDVVKTRQQLDTGKKGMGMIQTFRSILAHEG